MSARQPLDADQEAIIDYFMTDNAPAVEYLLERGVTPTDWAALEIELVPASVVCDRLGLGEHSKFRLGECAIWLPAWKTDGTIDPTYGHSVVFTRLPGTQTYKRDRPSVAAERHAQDLVFMPAMNGKPWDEQPSGSTVIVCESWLKAHAVSKLGYLAVAMNGVYGWCVGEGSQGAIVAGFKQPLWSDRKFKVAILTDSYNTRNKKSAANVRRAKTLLASRLVGDGEGVVDKDSVFVVEMPDAPKGGDWGVDDMLADPAYGPGAVERMISAKVPATLMPGREILLEEMNRKHCWIQSLGRAVDLFDGNLATKQTLADAYANVSYSEEVAKTARTPAHFESFKVFDAWFTSPERHQAHGLSFRPGLPQLVPVANAGEQRFNFNLWRGFDADPWDSTTDRKAGIARAEQYFYSTVIEAMGEREGNYFLDLMASIVQHPERAISGTAYLFGDGGVGKNFVGKAFQGLLGVHAKSMTLDQYTNGFNSHLKLARVALIEEVPATLDKQKQGITISTLKEDADANNKTRQLEMKGVDIRTVDRNCYPIVLSNYPPPWTFDDGMRRRSFVVRFDPKMAKHDAALSPWGTKDTAYWNERWTWFFTNGPRDLITALGARNISHFDPSADALSTKWLRDALMGDSTRDIDGFITSLRRDLGGILAVCEVPDDIAAGITHLSSTDVLRLYRQVNPGTPAGTKTVGMKLRAAFGVRKLNGKKPDGKQRTEELYELDVLKDSADPFQAVDALRKHLDGTQGGKY